MLDGPELQAVFFDMDGTLVNSEETWYEAEAAVLAELGGTEWTRAQQAAVVGGPLDRAAAYLRDSAGSTASVSSVAQRLLTEVEERLRRGPVHWLPGARELLLELRAAGVPIGLVSASFRPLVNAVLDAVAHEVADADGTAFEVTVAGDDLPRTKPDPDPYLHAAAVVGVDPAASIVIEDSPTGCASGLAAGCLVVAVPSVAAIPPAPRLVQRTSLADVTLTDLRQLMARGGADLAA